MNKSLISLLFLPLIISSCGGNNPAVQVMQTDILPHPRLLFIGEEEKKTNDLIKSESLPDSLYACLLNEAEKLLSTPMPSFELKEFNYAQHMLSACSRQVYRIVTLSMAYRFTGQKQFAAKAEEELLYICDFPNWNPSHFLDVAEMTVAVSVGYDWLYEVLSPETKQKIVAAIKEKALDEAVEAYKTGDSGSWAKRETNWNVICNSSMIIGTLAIAEHYPGLCEDIINNALKYMPNCLHHFAPDGVFPEGPGYWGYLNTYFTLLLKVLNDNFGHDFGLSETEGIEQTASYYIHSLSPSGRTFNFGNTNGTYPETNPVYFFFGKKFNQPELVAFYRKILSLKVRDTSSGYQRFFFLSIPWFDTSSPKKTSLPKLRVYNGSNAVIVFNGDRDIEGSLYLAAKTGKPAMAHQQLDVGSFIVESDGIRWADDLGADHYYLPGFWDYKPDGMRWKYFRNTNFSHNTLSIDRRIQYSYGAGEIGSYDTNTDKPYVTMDLSPMYREQASSVFRTFCMLDDKSISITDSIKLQSSGQTVRWTMITGANIRNFGKTILLTKDGKSFLIGIEQPSNAKFSVEEAKAYSDKEKPVEGYRLITVDVTGKKDQIIKITMSSDIADK